MGNDIRLTEAGKQYAAAHAAHYVTKDLQKAIELYKGVIAAHPNTPEAGYCHAQIQNIVKSVVPQQELLDAQATLALNHIEHEVPPDEPAPVTPPESKLRG